MTTARRTQQQRRDQAETALLNAAAELAVEHGVRSLTLARVGERAGYSRGIVTHHFGSKQGLILSLFAAGFAWMRRLSAFAVPERFLFSAGSTGNSARMAGR